jgi:hypothetical protein
LKEPYFTEIGCSPSSVDPDDEVTDDDEEEREAKWNEEKNGLKLILVSGNGDELTTAEATVVAKCSKLYQSYKE